MCRKMKSHLHWTLCLLALLENLERELVRVAHLDEVWLCALCDGEQGAAAMW